MTNARQRTPAPTPQTLDPLGGVAARYFAVTSTVLAFSAVTLLLALLGGTIESLPLQAGALAIFIAAAITNLVGVDPRNSPYGPVRHLLLHAAMVVAFALDCASRTTGAVGAWGAIALAILLLLIGAFRPSWEIAALTTTSAIAIGIISWLSAADGAKVLGEVIPLLAVGWGASAFSRVLVTRILSWQQENIAAVDTERAAIRSNQEVEASARRKDLVDYRVGPYLEQLLESDLLTPVDIARARGLATTLRTMLVRSARTSWLTDLVDDLDDPDHLLETLTEDQRRVVGAGLAEVRYSAPLEPGTLRATLSAGPPATLKLTAGLRAGEGNSGLRPTAYRAVLRSTFRAAKVDFGPTRIEVVVELG